MVKTAAVLNAEVQPIYYHGTASVYVDSIKAEGLVPRKSHGADYWARTDSWAKDHLEVSTDEPCVFLTAVRSQAFAFASLVASIQNPKAYAALFAVRLPSDAELKRDGHSFEETQSGKYFGVIPPKCLRLVKVAPINERAVQSITRDGYESGDYFARQLRQLMERGL